MDNPTETLRLTLLVTLLALLAYILYKKLITRLQKGNLVEDYIEFEDPINEGDGNFQVAVNFPQEEIVSLQILSPEGKSIQTLLDGKVEPGERIFEVKIEPGKGKHSLSLKTDRQSTECFIQG